MGPYRCGVRSSLRSRSRRGRWWRALACVPLCSVGVWAAAEPGTRAVVATGTLAPGARPAFELQTLNVFGLPWPVAPAAASRCTEIAAALTASAPDCVALQEVWTEAALAPFLQLGWHVAHCAADRWFGRSGLVTLSRHRIEVAEWRAFDAECGLDALANKGALRTSLVLPDRRLELWNLHLQSGEAAGATRRLQIEQMLDWVEEGSVDRFAAIVGDFNCVPGDAEFTRLAAGLAALGFRHLSCEQPTFACAGNALAAGAEPAEIDHVFLRDPERVWTATRVHDRPFVSDHCGVQVRADARAAVVSR